MLVALRLLQIVYGAEKTEKTMAMLTPTSSRESFSSSSNCCPKCGERVLLKQDSRDSCLLFEVGNKEATRHRTATGGSLEGAGARGKHHWIPVAPKGSLEIRSPLPSARRSTQALIKNRSDSKLSKAASKSKNRPSNSEDAASASSDNVIAVINADSTKAKASSVASADEDVDVPGALPRTLSTSVLRIKHRRTFWEKVVG